MQKPAKNKVISHFVAFLALHVAAAVASHFIPQDYRYSAFYAAGLFQFDVAKQFEKRFLKK
ncbi:MAG TPA: hypothetical protein VMV86_07130 [Methanosarcinales archaeon]|nr:hypothetical protein [Methanosarcinales archaeon]